MLTHNPVFHDTGMVISGLTIQRKMDDARIYNLTEITTHAKEAGEPPYVIEDFDKGE